MNKGRNFKNEAKKIIEELSKNPTEINKKKIKSLKQNPKSTLIKTGLSCIHINFPRIMVSKRELSDGSL